MTPFTLRLAGQLIEVHPLHDRVRALCNDYLVTGPAATASATDLVVRVSQADLDRERAASPEPATWDDAYLETLAVYRKIAEWAPSRRLMLVHGAVVAYRGQAYLFAAPSGTGKSTHVRLWQRYVGNEVQVVNGDKPLVAVPNAGPVVAYGTPWAGKEGWQANVSAPLAGICLLSRAGDAPSAIRPLAPAEALDRAFAQVYLPADAEALLATLDLLDALLARAPLWELSCDMSEDAVRVSFEALTGLGFDEARTHGGGAA